MEGASGFAFGYDPTSGFVFIRIGVLNNRQKLAEKHDIQ